MVPGIERTCERFSRLGARVRKSERLAKTLGLECVCPWRPPHMPTIPDILHSTPTRRIDLERTKLALTLALASGTSGGLFAEALDSATFAPSSFRPAEFAEELFLQRFVAQGLRAKIAGSQPVMHARHLFRLLSQPPADSEIVQFRRNILVELTEKP